MYHRYLHGIAPDADEHNLSSETSATVRNLGMGTSMDSTWVLPSQVSSSPAARPKNDSQLLDSSQQMHLPNLLEPMIDSTISKRRHQHCFFGSEIDSPGTVKQEQQSMRPFFNEWPTAKESWSNLDDEESNKNNFSTTQLSISIPMAPSDFSSRSACSPNGENWHPWKNSFSHPTGLVFYSKLIDIIWFFLGCRCLRELPL